MERRVAAAAAAAVVIAALVLSASAGGGVPPATTPTDTPPQEGTAAASGLTGPTGSPSPYTFDDEFDGSSLGDVWQRNFHCCGDLAGFDPSLSTVADGFLAMSVAHRADGWYGDLIDTKGSWTQLYGYFEARIKVPNGTGLWPAFWSYFSGERL